MTHLPPQCVEDENRLLDLLEKEPNLTPYALVLRPGDFYREANRERFKAIINEHSPQDEVYSLVEKILFTSRKRHEIQESYEKITEVYEQFGLSEPGINE